MNESPATIDMDTFRWRLAETIAWCTRYPDHIQDKFPDLRSPRDSLRTPRLRPPSFYYPETVYRQRAIVDQLCDRRADDLSSGYSNRYPKEPATNLAGGRLLLYYPDENLFDGAAESESDGFFNVENEPPWDIWLCLLEDIWYTEKAKHYSSPCLLSWAPPQFLELANIGIAVNPEDCIVWLSNYDTPLTRQLKEVGLLG